MHAHRRPNYRLPVALVVVTGLLAGGWLVLRDSSLVAVRKVEVTGLSGPQGKAIRAALTTAGRDMTTLHVRPAVLTSAVAPYAVVKDVAVERDVPHGLRIRVSQRIPVARIATSEAAVPVAADGTVLRGTTADDVPELKLGPPPAGDAITDRHTLVTIALLARAPAGLRRRVTTAFRGPRGLTVRFAAGPSVHFGSSERMTAKWASLTAVLASPDSRGATSIDVRVPEHPAAAGLEQASVQRGQRSTGT
ncbi:MAG: cell division protein FtsQ/DivIB [Actinomycetota bacterium]|nr:cell division protein FtsQ/DivIB [Actinomycetota bacterium]